ncbi:MAG: response regulator [Cryobacterium sp.]|nr:response regulator [Oligoflexia bacterium]
MNAQPVVLAVEDDPEFLKALQVVLSRFGLKVIGAASAEDFMKVMDQLRPDLYLIDLQLGTECGFELIKKLRSDLKVIAPVLVISGTKATEQIAHAIELGANDYIVKPLDRIFLASKLSRFLDVEQLDEHTSEYRNLPSGRVAARIEFKSRVLVVDELGVKLTTSSLVPKGTVLKLRCEPLRQAGIENGEALVTVVSTELDLETQSYLIYVEFDGVDSEFMQSIRRWLTEKTV